MTLKTQGTNLYFIDPDATGGPAVVAVGCVTSIGGISVARDQIETTCLEGVARTYEPGMPTPGQMTFGINFDPSDPSHARIFDLFKAGTKVDMALAYSDGTAPPTLDTSDLFDFPTTRSFIHFEDAYFADVPQDLALNSVVTSTVAVQLSGFPTLFPKA